MPSKCVPWIVLQVSCSTRTSRESLRPPKRPSKAKNGQNITFLDISGSVLSDFANFPASPLKHKKNAAFGSHVAPSVLQIDLWKCDRSSSVHHYKSGRNSSLFTLPCFLFYFWAIFGQKSLRVHHWDVLESISGVLDPYRSHFRPWTRSPLFFSYRLTSLDRDSWDFFMFFLHDLSPMWSLTTTKHHTAWLGQILDMTEISFFFTFWTKNFDFLFFDSDHLETYNAPIGPIEAEILSRCRLS